MTMPPNINFGPFVNEEGSGKLPVAENTLLKTIERTHHVNVRDLFLTKLSPLCRVLEILYGADKRILYCCDLISCQKACLPYHRRRYACNENRVNSQLSRQSLVNAPLFQVWKELRKEQRTLIYELYYALFTESSKTVPHIP
uniref:Uncharacterized protein n=1 Tax=Glossina pallidipes TaxID=7398 RepID=A0A1B0AE69_GLOPL